MCAEQRGLNWKAIAALSALAVIVRVLFLGLKTADAHFWVLPWYEGLLADGARALARDAPAASEVGFGGYAPPYYYLLYAATYFDGLMPRLYLIKSVSMAFDLVLAGVVFAVVRYGTGSILRAQLGMFAVLLAPTVVANSAVWGQCDVIYTSLLLASVYFSVVDRPIPMLVALGASFAFKAQAVFLAPYVLMLLGLSRLRWTHLVAGALAYLGMMVPAVLLGRPLLDVMLVYLRQGDLYHKLSMNAPNVYYFISDQYYDVGVAVGLAVTIIGSLIYAYLPRRNAVLLSPRFLILAATVSVSLAPFLLPKMHDRYFLPADVLSIALAMFEPRLWFIPVLFQVSSGLSYVPAISDSFYNFDYEYVALMPLASAINVVLVPYLLLLYWGAVRRFGTAVLPTRTLATS